MRIDTVHINGYRCIGDLDVPFDNLTAFVGAGGVGKSTILNALDWFFTGGDLQARDFHWAPGEETPVEQVLVAVTFSGLTDADREVLGRYGKSHPTTLTRTYSEEGGVKLSGNALVLPEFEHVRAAENAMGIRNRYKELFEEKGEALSLPDPVAKRQVVEANMEEWERANPSKCQLSEVDARHLHGAVGTSLLASRFRYVLVRAAEQASDILESGRGSALNRLLSAVEELGDAKKHEIAELQRETQGKIEKLIKDARGADLVRLSTGLTERVKRYFPDASIKLTDEVEPPRDPSVTVHAQVSDRGGRPMDPEMQGHGLQRAIVIALLHELAESLSAEGSEQESATADPGGVMLAIEEPELYQHPLQARALAASLGALTTGRTPPIQVAYSTHSPYFTSPALFGRLRLCRRGGDGGTSCVPGDQRKIEEAIGAARYRGDLAHKVAETLAQSLREAIFARSVLLTEGPTDAAMLHGVADVQGGLDREGVAIAACGTKSNLGPAIVILQQLEIPFFVLFDSDAVHGQERSKELNRRLLALCGEPEEDWPDRDVRQRSANFKDTLETDLSELWPAYDEARKEIAKELGVKDDKKDPRAYRDAVAGAGEPPEFILDVLDAARKLAS
jgi:predicted ATP-dependent endonuclease of OLD family